MGQAILKGLSLPEDSINFTLIPHESDQPGKEAFLKYVRTTGHTCFAAGGLFTHQ